MLKHYGVSVDMIVHVHYLTNESTQLCKGFSVLRILSTIANHSHTTLKEQEKFLAKWHNLKLLFHCQVSVLSCGALEITKDKKWISYASKYNIPQLMSYGLIYGL